MDAADVGKMYKGHFTAQSLYVAADVHVYRFEELDKAMQDICKKLGIEYKQVHKNKTNHKHYSTYYTPELVEIIRSLYESDIKKFNYKFDGIPSAIHLGSVDERLQQINVNINDQKYHELLTTFYEEKLTPIQLFEFYRLSMIVNKKNKDIGSTYCNKVISSCCNVDFLLTCYNNREKLYEIMSYYISPIIVANIFSQKFVIVSQLEINSSLGNQLFRLATAIAYALENNRLFISKPWMYAENFEFNILPIILRENDNIVKMSRQAVLHEENPQVFSSIPRFDDNIVNLYGSFYSEQYFKVYDKQIRTILQWSPMMVEKCKDIIAMNNVNCSIHVGMSDNLESYYISAINHILGKYPKTQFYIFSDGKCDTLKNNLIESCSLSNDSIKVISGHSDIEDMYLISQCKHNIITNSTFSWWSAWININSNKIVCRPAKNLSNYNNIVYPEEWIKIDT